MAILAGVSVALGILMLAMTFMLYSRPELHVAWGVAILVFAAASITSVFSGYGGLGLGVIGMGLRIVGGAVAIALRARRGMPRVVGPAGADRGWTARGRMGPFGYSFCPVFRTP